MKKKEGESFCGSLSFLYLRTLYDCMYSRETQCGKGYSPYYWGNFKMAFVPFPTEKVDVLPLTMLPSYAT